MSTDAPDPRDLFADPAPASTLAAGVAVAGPLVAVAVARPRRRWWARVWAHGAAEPTYAAREAVLWIAEHRTTAEPLTVWLRQLPAIQGLRRDATPVLTQARVALAHSRSGEDHPAVHAALDALRSHAPMESP